MTFLSLAADSAHKRLIVDTERHFLSVYIKLKST